MSSEDGGAGASAGGGAAPKRVVNTDALVAAMAEREAAAAAAASQSRAQQRDSGEEDEEEEEEEERRVTKLSECVELSRDDEVRAVQCEVWCCRGGGADWSVRLVRYYRTCTTSARLASRPRSSTGSSTCPTCRYEMGLEGRQRVFCLSNGDFMHQNAWFHYALTRFHADERSGCTCARTCSSPCAASRR